MAEVFNINVDFTSVTGKLLWIPELIRVPRGSIVAWNLRINLSSRAPIFRDGLKFTVYFREDSPFDWKRESLRLPPSRFFRPIGPFSSNIKEEVEIAEGRAENIGEYKYGIRVSAGSNDESIYDEDPYIYVF